MSNRIDECSQDDLEDNDEASKPNSLSNRSNIENGDSFGNISGDEKSC